MSLLLRGILVATLAATIDAKVRGSTSARQKFGLRFRLHAHLVPPLGPQHRVPEPVPSLETHLKSEQVKGRPNGCRYIGCKEETRLKSNGRVNGKTPRYGRRWTPTRAGAQDTRASLIA